MRAFVKVSHFMHLLQGFGMATYERGLKETQTKAMEAIAKANNKAKEQVKDRRLQQRQKGGHVERATRATA